MPPAIVQRLTEVHQQFLAPPQTQARMSAGGLTVSPGVCGTAFLKKMETESVRWGRVVKATGFVAD